MHAESCFDALIPAEFDTVIETELGVTPASVNGKVTVNAPPFRIESSLRKKSAALPLTSILLVCEPMVKSAVVSDRVVEKPVRVASAPVGFTV